MKEVLKDTFIKYHDNTREIDRGQKPGLRISAISGELFRPKDETIDMYARIFKEALKDGYREACKARGVKIDFGNYGYEICAFKQEFYKAFNIGLTNGETKQAVRFDESQHHR